MAADPRSRLAGRAGRRRALLLGLCAGIAAALPAAAEEALPLAAGGGGERALAAGQSHVYRVAPAAGGPLLLVIEQRGIDVEVEVASDDGERFVVDGPFDRRGHELVLLAGTAPRRVTLRGREPGAPPGRYAVRLKSLAAGGGDGADRRLAAVLASAAAGRLYPLGTADAWREAIGHHRRAAAHWRALGEAGEEARALYAAAVLHRLVDAAREGLAEAEDALALFRPQGDPLAGYALNEIGLDRWQLGEGEAARAAFAAAAGLGAAGGDPFLAAAAASNLCLMELSAGELAGARDCYRAALPGIEAARAAQIESAARTNLGRIAEHLGEPEEALGHYRRALAVLAAADDRRGQARTLNNLGVLLRGLGDFDAAMARYAEALDIFERLGERRWQARVLSNIGAAYRALGERRRARVAFERAGELFRAVEDGRGEAATLDNLGLVEREDGDAAAALALHRRALALRREIGDRRGEAVTLRHLGEAHAELGDPREALARLGAAVTLAGELGDRPAEAAARRGRGEIHLARGELEAARSELEAALTLAAGSGRRTDEAQVLLLLARAERAAGRHGMARRRVGAALERLEDLRARIDAPGLRTSYSSLLRDAYALAVELSMEAHRADPAAGHQRRALALAERARARAFLDLLQEARVDLGAGVDPALHARRRGLARRLAAKTARLVDPELDAASRALLEAEQVATLQALDAVDAEIRRASPGYADLVRPRPLDAAGIQALVDPGTTLAVYFLGETRSWLWRVTPGAIDAFALAGRAELETAARRVHERWSELDVAARAGDHRAAAELARLLRLPELAGTRRLAVVADGALHLVPFAALPIAGPNGGAPSPLVTRVEVAVLPSASVLALDRRLHPAAAVRPTAAVLADPPSGAGFPPLPASRREAEAVAAAAPGATLTALGADASRRLVESGRLAGRGVVHFATHAVVDAENPALSGLVLGQAGADGRSRPVLLHLDDVFRLDLDADLVVLSGCRTALGAEVRGEGLIGLARGFQHAGARRVLASLWRVDDRATAELMTRFYRALWKDGLPPAAALAAAQRELAGTRRFRDPYHWAAFVLVGDWR